MTEPHVRAWADQFGALLRDKCRLMIIALRITEWEHMAHVFTDPADGDVWELVYDEGLFTVQNLDDEEGEPVALDLRTLGVIR